MSPRFRNGLLIVTQIGTNDVPCLRRDFDASEWSYEWVTLRNGVAILRLLHDGAPDAVSMFEVAEFSGPVSIEFQAE